MSEATVKIVRFHTLGGADVLQIDELPVPEPKAGEVRLRVKAIGLNRAEVMFREGHYLQQPVLPSKLGYEASGIVEAIGPEVDTSWLGKTVSTVPAFPANKYGVHGEAAIVPTSALVSGPRAGASTSRSALQNQSHRSIRSSLPKCLRRFTPGRASSFISLRRRYPGVLWDDGFRRGRECAYASGRE